MNRPSSELHDLLGSAWPVVLQHLDDAVLILDDQRILRFVNERARRLLGYHAEPPVGERCRLTTRGLDCDDSCPLTFALEGNIDRVDNFATVYQTKEGHPVPLNVTVIPLLDEDENFQGAVEILRPTDPDPGFVLAGHGQSSLDLRRKMASLAQSGSHLVLVGESSVVIDVARTVHRFSGVAESLFHWWSGSWDEVPDWPPGTLFASGSNAASALAAEPPSGWRVIVGVADLGDLKPDAGVAHEVVELPRASDLDDDLPLLVAARAEQLAPRISVAPAALARLCRIARDFGFDHLEAVLRSAVAAAGMSIEEAHIPADSYDAAFLDELLEEPDPLAALEQRLLREVLCRSGWRMQEAADRLGISRVTLWRKLKEHGIERPENEG